MNKSLKSLAALVVVLFLVALAGLVTFTAVRGEERTPVTGGLERVISAAEDANLGVTAMMIADVYGQEYIAGLPVCPGTETQQLQDALGLGSVEGLPRVVEEDRNYLLLVDMQGNGYADGADIDRVNLCANAQLISRGIQAGQPLLLAEETPNPLAPQDAGTPWALLG